MNFGIRSRTLIPVPRVSSFHGNNNASLDLCTAILPGNCEHVGDREAFASLLYPFHPVSMIVYSRILPHPAHFPLLHIAFFTHSQCGE